MKKTKNRGWRILPKSGQTTGNTRSSVGASKTPPTSSPPPTTQTPSSPPQAQQAPQPAQQQANPPQAPQQAVQQPQKQGNVDSRGFSDYDAADYHSLYNGRGYYRQQNLTQKETIELAKYMNPNTEAGSLYNYSQNMNQALINGNMTPGQRATFNTIIGAMHNVGYNINLTRYDHGGALDDMLRQVGITGGHDSISIAQMRKALVGASYSDKRILSTSYNDFQRAQDPSTFTTREVKITYRVKASAKGMMPGISQIPMRGSGMTKGDDFGEFLLAPPQGRIVDIKYSGNKARAKGGSKYNLNKRQIEIVIEID